MGAIEFRYRRKHQFNAGSQDVPALRRESGTSAAPMQAKLPREHMAAHFIPHLSWN
jgi:hypothetical protein